MADSTLLLCTGAPANPSDDQLLAEFASVSYDGKIVMGGTTAKIIARELNTDITVNLSRDPSGLPPTSTIEGFDVVSEGVLTLTAVRNFLQNLPCPTPVITQIGVKFDIARLLLNAKYITIIEGMHINQTHLCPNLPVKLERRADLIRDLSALLAEKFQKCVTHKCI